MSAKLEKGGSLVTCPSCGRQIEPVAVCYYCCTAVAPACRVSEGRLALWALATALLGVALMGWATFVSTPVTPVAELSRGGAFQHYRVVAQVVRTAYSKTPYADADLYSYWLDDGSGETPEEGLLKLKVEGPVQADLEAAGKAPGKGDRIDVEGTLYAGDGFRLLALNSAAMLTILSREEE